MTLDIKSSGINIPDTKRIAVAQYCTKNRNRYETAMTNPHVANNDGYISINSVTKYRCGC